jgi:hypothetical protein
VALIAFGSDHRCGGGDDAHWSTSPADPVAWRELSNEGMSWVVRVVQVDWSQPDATGRGRQLWMWIGRQ